MKKLIVLFYLFVPFLLFAKFYNGEIIYNNGSSKSIQIALPISATKQSITVKINDKKESIKIAEIKYLIVSLNDNQNKYLFKRGNVSRVNKAGEIITKEKTHLLSLVDEAYEDIIVSCDALQYIVKKIKGKETLIAVYHGGIGGYVLSAPDDDRLLFFMNHPKALRVSISRSEAYLFSKCPGFSESINYKELNRRGSFVHEIAEKYNHCIKN
jgi:hypothetical protein